MFSCTHRDSCFFSTCRSSPGLFSPASSPTWRWWSGLCFMKQVTLPSCGAASLSRPAPLSEPSPCSLWSTSITCLPGVKNVRITAASRSQKFKLSLNSVLFFSSSCVCHRECLFLTLFSGFLFSLGLVCFCNEASSPDSEASELVKAKTFPDKREHCAAAVVP